MQLVEAAILFFVGSIAGVLVTTFDVYAVGSAAFFSRVSLWVLINVIYGANVRSRRAATLGAIPLDLGFVEMYYLTTSYTYPGLARSLMAPLALLSLVGALVALLAWTAKSERNLYGLLITAFIVVATLVACVLLHDGPVAHDYACVALMVLVLLVLPSMRLTLVRSQREPQVAPADDGSTRRVSTNEDRGARARRQQLSSSPRRKPARKATGSGNTSNPDKAGQGSANATSSRQAKAPAKPSVKPSVKKAGSQRASSTPRPSSRRSSSKGAERASSRKAERATTQRPTRRTGGTMPTTDVIHTRSASSRRRDGANARQSASASTRGRSSGGRSSSNRSARGGRASTREPRSQGRGSRQGTRRSR